MSQPKKPNASLSRLILSHITTLLHFIKSLPAISSDGEVEAGKLLVEAIGESGKLLPWFLGARKHLRAYLKVSGLAIPVLPMIPGNGHTQ